MFYMISKSSTSQRRLEHDATHDCVTCLRNYKVCDLTCLVNYEGHVSFLKALQWIHLEAIDLSCMCIANSAKQQT